MNGYVTVFNFYLLMSAINPDNAGTIYIYNKHSLDAAYPPTKHKASSVGY